MSNDKVNKRFDKADKPFDKGDGGARRPRPQADRGMRFSQDGEVRGAAGALIALDFDIMKLLVRRAKLVSRIRGGKDHASTPQAIQEEKAVRTAWEKNALSFSKDPKFSRQLFSLLQDLEVLSKEEADKSSGFKLAPAQQPVSINITGPASSFEAQMFIALSAALGQPMRLEPLLLADSVVELVKALSQCGVPIAFRLLGKGMCSVVAEKADPVSFVGKTTYVGDSLFSLYLLCFLAAGQTGVCRLTGGSNLKNADLSALRNLLPALGARLAHKVPRSTGLPADLECSGLIPAALSVPPDIPFEGLCALLLAPLVWGKSLVLDLSEISASDAAEALAQCNKVFSQLGAEVEVDGPKVSYMGGQVTLPEKPFVTLDPALCGYILAFPAFLGGTCRIRGRWDAKSSAAADTRALLAWAGLALEVSEDAVSVSVKEAPFTTPLHEINLEGPLSPLYCALLAKSQQLARNPVELPYALPEGELQIVQDFFAQLGLILQDKTVTRQEGQEGDAGAASLPWSSPSAYWSLGLVLLSCIRAGLALANPGTVSAMIPPFWHMLNGLPQPADPVDAQPVMKDSNNGRPTRRRIIAE